MNDTIKMLREEGYPLKIKGNGGFIAVLYGIQPLLDGEYEAIYRYPGGECPHCLEEIKRFFEVIEK